MTLSRRRFVHLLGAGSAASLFVPAATARGLEARFAAPDERRPRPAEPELIRLDSNENPDGPDRAAIEAMTAAMAMAHRYPDDVADALRAAVARVQGVTLDNVVLGAGSTDVLRAAVVAFTSPTRHLVTAAPSYEAAPHEATLVGAATRAVPVRGDLRLDLAAMAEAARGAGLVYLCNPNNPTATVHGKAAIDDFVARVLKDTPDCTILVDEAYHEYVEEPTYATAIPLALANPRVVVARTFSKVHGLAGMRVGYGIAQQDTIARLAPRVLDIGVNLLGAAAAKASLEAKGRVESERARNHEARELTRRFFAGAGYAPVPSDANFMMVDVRRDAKAFRAACRAKGVLIGRAFPPLLTHARITIGTMDEMQRATEVFKQVLSAT